MGRPVLIQALDGFIDAGGAKRIAREHLLATYESQVVATFDVDQLLDYRARRPAMLFVEDHWASYDDPLLVDESSLPTADELGAELERFLAEQSQDPPQ
jgi:hypothetical protein